VNEVDSWLAEAAMVMNCKIGSIIFVYLGLPIEGDARRVNFWEPLIDCI
jgi:hypothetical protein